jgi:hypothetical protein
MRVINGVPKRYIEYFDQSTRIIDSHPILVDSGLSYNGTEASISVTPAATTGIAVHFTAGAAKFAAGDVGKQIRQIAGGQGRATITVFNSATDVTATITNAFPNTNLIPGGSWGIAVKTVTGLSHLEAKTVQIVGDGAMSTPKVVTAGSVPLDFYALKIDAGLGFIPELQTLRPGMQTQDGNAVFATKGLSKVWVLFNRTIGAEVNGEQIPWRVPADLMDQGVPVKTQIVAKTNLGYDEDARITIRQPQPMPITVIAIQSRLEIGDD